MDFNSSSPYPEGVISFLDTDLYKLTMQCAVFKYFKDVPVTYGFTNRTPEKQLSRAAYRWLEAQITSASYHTYMHCHFASELTRTVLTRAWEHLPPPRRAALPPAALQLSHARLPRVPTGLPSAPSRTGQNQLHSNRRRRRGRYRSRRRQARNQGNMGRHHPLRDPHPGPHLRSLLQVHGQRLEL